MAGDAFRPDDVTGLILAGGRGSRMGGVDKGLQPWHGRPLVDHALDRLTPQVGPVLISANRHLDDYRRRGHPVLPDALPDHAGPLAGLAQGLQACTTPWLAMVPCDSPRFPADLVHRLHDRAISSGAPLTVAQTQGKYQPVFCLVRVSLAPGLQQFLAEGGRTIYRWLLAQKAAAEPFDDASAFANANTMEELRAMEMPDHG